MPRCSLTAARDECANLPTLCGEAYAEQSAGHPLLIICGRFFGSLALCKPVLLVIGLYLVLAGVGEAASVTTLIKTNAPLVSIAPGEDGLMVAGEHSLIWYQRDGNGYTQRWEQQWAPPHHFLHVDLLDLDGDRVPEALVTNLRDGQLASLILRRTADGTWAPIAEGLAWYLRVLDDGRLLGQRRGSHQAFRGPVVGLRWRNGTLHRSEHVVLPRGTSLYQFRRLPNDRLLTAADDGRLRLWEREDGTTHWRRVEHWPVTWRGLSGRMITMPSRGLTGDTQYEGWYLPLLPWPGADGLIVAQQRPAWGQVVGRQAVWRGWKLQRASYGSDPVQNFQTQAQLSGRGTLMDIRSHRTHEAIGVIRLGSEQPFQTEESIGVVVHYRFD